jgi:hypothetical protein
MEEKMEPDGVTFDELDSDGVIFDVAGVGMGLVDETGWIGPGAVVFA